MIRVIIAGVLGGIVVFNCGYVEHMLFHWGEPKGKLASEAAFAEFIKGQNLQPDFYFFPGMPAETSKEEMDKLNERYKQGPSGILLIAPTGEDALSPHKLIAEAVTNVVCALVAAAILALLAPGTNFCTRWLVVLLIGFFAWLSIDASYGIWYRFPSQFVHEQLYCALFEWGVGGLVIAAIAKPRAAQTGN